MATGFEEIDAVLDPDFEIPSELEPDLSDLLPKSYLSISQAQRFINCPHQWELIYIQGKPQKTSARMFQGVFVHEAAEMVLNERLATGTAPSMDKATDVFSDAFENGKKLIEDWEGEDPGTTKDVGVKCTREFYKNAAPASTPVSVEKTFHTIIKSVDGKTRLPVLGRIDSVQVQAFDEADYQRIRQELSAGRAPGRPLRIHDLKVSTDKWTEAELNEDLQFGIYAHVEGVPDVQVDNVVKGRAKVSNPRYQSISAVMDPKFVAHSVKVIEDVAKSIALGHFPRTNPSNWFCSEKWCSVWSHCRGAK